MVYMVTFTINIPPMLVDIPYMDPMGNDKPQLLIDTVFFYLSTGFSWNCWYLLRPQPCNHNQHEIRWNKTCWVDVGVYPIFIHFFVYWCQSTFWQDSEYIGTISQTLGIESKQNVTRTHEIIKCERTGSLFPKNAFNGDVKANNKIHWLCKHLVWNSMVSNDCRIDRVLVFRK